jgi:hypothetical protein
VLFLFTGNTLYMLLAPDMPYFAPPKHWTFWCCFYYIVQYVFLFGVSYVLYKKSNHSVDKLALIAVMIYIAGMFTYNIFLINSSLITYIEYCNSKSFSIAFSVFLWSLTFAFKKLAYER